jgi:putative intracellular protease/amidase
MPKALIVVTNVGKFEKEDKATGLWLAEAVHFYEKLIKAGWTVDFVSPKGGFVPIDPASLQKENMTPSDWKHYTCPDFQKKLQSSLKPSDVKADDYQCIYYSGGHGVVFDFPDNKELQQIAQDIYKKGGVVSSVCHGAVGLLHIKD